MIDAGTITTGLTAVGGIVATIIVATSKRRDSRIDQYDSVVAERDKWHQRYAAVRAAYDAAFGYIYRLRTQAYERGDEPEPIPDDARYKD